MAPKSQDSGDVQVAVSPFHMQAVASIDENGKVVLSTHTSSHLDLRGFHGTAYAEFFDKNGHKLYACVGGPYGVDGRNTPFGSPSDRNDTETFAVNPDIYYKTDTIRVWAVYTPQASLQSVMDWIKTNGPIIIQFIQMIIQLIGSLNSSGNGDTYDPGDNGQYNTGDGGYAVASSAEALCQALATPTLVSPLDNQVQNDQNDVDLTWNAVNSADNYFVEIESTTDSVPGPATVWSPYGHANPPVSPTRLHPDPTYENYRWRVTAKNGSGLIPDSQPSNFWHFTCKRPIVTLPAPSSIPLETPRRRFG